MTLNLGEIEQRVADLNPDGGFDFVYDLLLAYGLPKASITRLRKGTYNRSKIQNERLWKGRLFYKYVDDPSEDLYSTIDSARRSDRIMSEDPRFLIVRDHEQLLAVDTRTNTTLDTPVVDLHLHTAFFLPWAGIEKAQLESLNYADVKAAEKMARLYDEINRHNTIQQDRDVHGLNVFFSRLLFCFFAEDTEVFSPASFTNAVASFTTADGTDTASFLDQLFVILDTEIDERGEVPSHFQNFAYVNGSLFSGREPSPSFSSKARQILLECGTLDWSKINPDIFGSMIQAVVRPEDRDGFGMHYTSVENIMKVLRPLMLDDLRERFDRADSVAKLERLLDHLSRIKLFDPACGSGNFLVIAYKELRSLEHMILQRISELDPSQVGLFKLSRITLDQFYGMEIDDFAHEIAILSLWLAKHQMNIEFRELFGVEIALVPLQESGNIVCVNATRVDWEDICPKEDRHPVFVLGNPPYLGGKLQTQTHKDDFVTHFGTSDYPRNLDYVALWFLKGAAYVADGRAELGFVSTNSVSQGDHVGMMWPHVLDAGVEVSFAHESFLWTNRAKGNAGVTCVVVGLTGSPSGKKKYYSAGQVRLVDNINPYLKPSKRNTIVYPSTTPRNELPRIQQGSRAVDGGHLILSREGRRSLIEGSPAAARFVFRFVGSREFINGVERYCLWIDDDEAEVAREIPAIATRLEAVRKSRLNGGVSARSVADTPYRFGHRAHRQAPSVIVPRTSSERRRYIPMGFLDGSTVVSDAAYVVYDAKPWVFGLLQSRMHQVWARAVSGRLKTDIRYSGKLVYNTFPVPHLGPNDHETVTMKVMALLSARELFSHLSLAEIYDPEAMPEAVMRAHQGLDEVVEAIYRSSGFESDDDRLELLFMMYDEEIRAKDREDSLA